MARNRKSAGSQAPTRRDVITGLSVGVASVSFPLASTAAASVSSGVSMEEIHRTAESIHQTVAFNASPARVYAALTDARQFHQVTLLGAAIKSGMVEPTKPAEISRKSGGAFAVFGGHISGRIIEMVANLRLVQAWRAGDWAPGAYSIARFELLKDGAGTRLVFDHLGFPEGQAAHLAEGWRENYWAPLAIYLQRSS